MNQEHQDEHDELRKLLPWAKSWNQLYLWVLGELVLTIGLLYLFSKAFA